MNNETKLLAIYEWIVTAMDALTHASMEAPSDDNYGWLRDSIREMRSQLDRVESRLALWLDDMECID